MSGHGFRVTPSTWWCVFLSNPIQLYGYKCAAGRVEFYCQKRMMKGEKGKRVVLVMEGAIITMGG